MDAATVTKLKDLNTNFYKSVAPHFSATRDYAWQGWEKLVQILKEHKISPKSILDLGCGNGRFAHFAKANFDYTLYIGVDSNDELLTNARQTNAFSGTEFINQDILDTPELSLNGAKFDLVVVFGVMHHIPGIDLQTKFLEYAKSFLAPNGLLVISFWDFLSVPKLKNKIITPELAGFLPTELEANEYILSWSRGALAYRYCHFYPETEIRYLKDACGLEQLANFAADGPTNVSNNYYIFNAK